VQQSSRRKLRRVGRCRGSGGSGMFAGYGPLWELFGDFGGIFPNTKRLLGCSFLPCRGLQEVPKRVEAHTVRVRSAQRAFAAVKQTNSLVTWGAFSRPCYEIVS
jgi:hypothetical protein